MGREENKKILVTGGGGFVGRALIKRLLDQGFMVSSISRNRYPTLDQWGVKQAIGDLRNRTFVREAIQNHQIIFHVAAKAGYWGSYTEYYQSNVVATRNLLEEGARAGIEQFIYTSSASAVFGGKPIENGHRNKPYPRKPLNAYTKTKALAEQLVLSEESFPFKRLALRPHIIWGPGDRHLVPRLLARAEAGKLKQIGRGNNIIDSVHIENFIDAQLLAMNALETKKQVNRQAYFVTNDDPVNLWDFINQILTQAGLDPVKSHIPARIAKSLSWLLTGFHKTFNPKQEPLLTPFLVDELAKSHWFDITDTKKDLGYEPKISLIQGLNQLFT